MSVLVLDKMGCAVHFGLCVILVLLLRPQNEESDKPLNMSVCSELEYNQMTASPVPVPDWCYYKRSHGHTTTAAPPTTEEDKVKTEIKEKAEMVSKLVQEIMEKKAEQKKKEEEEKTPDPTTAPKGFGSASEFFSSYYEFLAAFWNTLNGF